METLKYQIPNEQKEAFINGAALYNIDIKNIEEKDFYTNFEIETEAWQDQEILDGLEQELKTPNHQYENEGECPGCGAPTGGTYCGFCISGGA